MSTIPVLPSDDVVTAGLADQRAVRLSFPPSYCLVGVYRLLHDPTLRSPIWDKCKHGVVRGGIVGLVWATFTWKAQKTFVEVFLINSPKVTGLNNDALFGYQIPLATCAYHATFIFLSNQFTFILRFFLSKNLRIARERAWLQTVRSRGKGDNFWQPYVEEWARPPVVVEDESPWKSYLGNWASRWLLTKVLLAPLDLYPFVGQFISAYFKAMQTSRYLHLPYFQAKKMDKPQIGVFIEERKWDYRAFGFTAALLESIPILGLFFTVSNRIGGAMWAFDLEKRQHDFASGKLAPIEPVATSTGVEMNPARTTHDRAGAKVEDVKRDVVENGGSLAGSMAGSWENISR
ncbi:hypothetical protein EXIGLDRAFT_601302 [Exidia glandulosa HHB12029]|uniref:Uncharacterized protein n=1 Tax=Exidia glandulosa HHB12029 TaxID=1314781 RepID=A0A165PXY1_EXIGL|nr:hypothetical protein EXIGLDRAFT_601302 [Exidia glandulosa HHB12029]